MQAIPHGRFIVASEYEIQSDTTLSLPMSTSNERFLSYKVVDVGHLVNAERNGIEVISKDDIVLVKATDVNTIYFNGNTIYYIDGDFCIKIKE